MFDSRLTLKYDQLQKELEVLQETVGICSICSYLFREHHIANQQITRTTIPKEIKGNILGMNFSKKQIAKKYYKENLHESNSAL